MLAIIIIAAILALLLLYPVRLDGDFRFMGGRFQGWLKLRPLFLLPKPTITVWDSEADSDEEKKKQKKEEKQGVAEKKKEERLGISELGGYISEILDIIISGQRGIKRLPVRIKLQYSLENPAHTAEMYGLIFAVLPMIFGDVRKLQWRIRIDPIWTVEEFCFFLQVRVTTNVLLLLLIFFMSIKKSLTLVWKIVRRKRNERSSHRNPDFQRVGES